MGSSDKDIQGGDHLGQNNYHTITFMVTFKKKSFHFHIIKFKKTFIALLTLKEYLVPMESCTRNKEEFFCFYVTFCYDLENWNVLKTTANDLKSRQNP